MASREKRKKPEKPSTLSKAIDGLREAREGKVKRVDNFTVEQASVYTELDEEEYENRKRRRQKFVVEDDDGNGYDDNGDEDLENDEEEEEFDDFEEAEVDGPKKTKRAKVAANKSKTSKPAEKKKPEPQRNQRLTALMKGSGATAQKTPEARKEVTSKSTKTGDDELESMLDDLVANPKEKSKSSPSPSPSILSKPKPAPSTILNKPPVTPAPLKTSQQEKTKKAVSPVAPKSAPKPAPVVDDVPMTDSSTTDVSSLTDNLPDSFFDDTPLDVPAPAIPSPAVSSSVSKPTVQVDTPQGKKKVDIQQHTDSNDNDWWALGQNASIISEESTTTTVQDLPSDTLGDLQMFWFDALEDYHNPGTIYLFGKIYLENEKRYVSCTVTVKNMLRCCFIAPRPFILDEHGDETSEVPTRDDINKELEKTRHELGIKKWMTKSVKRTYCFDGHPDVPRGLSEYIKAKYPATSGAIASDLTGRTFSHIFGTHTSLLELFLLKRRIMGPSWISVKNASKVPVQVTWSKYQVSVESMSDISVTKEAPPAPALSVLSLKTMTVLDETSHTNEIVMVSGIYHPEVSVDGPTSDPHKKFSHFTALRALKSAPLPFDFNQAIKKYPAIQPCTNERALLSCVIGKINSLDPDIIVGHNFLGFDLDVLLHRMDALKIPHWSKLGRLKTTKMPKLQSGRGGASDSTWAEKGVMAGRLVCDTWISSKDLLREKNYRLSDLAESQLGIVRKEIEPEEVSAYYENSDSLIYLTKYTENDCFLAMSLMFKLMLLPLTKQLTNISGNLWGHSLMGRRAERIEYLLLHEFYSKKFIAPDKATMKEKMEKKGKDGKAVKSKKPKYAGGLVLAPEQGLYDKYVLLLDFNSLYPSIIQEYNICFTTTERHQNSDGTWEEASPPPPGTDQGVLPKVIRYLVQCRRDVKNVMKAETNPIKLKQLDIRQQAIKLIANSMYGCLGFTFSRFYAHPLAELVTRKGRETLQRAVEAAKAKNLHVIYGDTDSIMINTGLTDLNAVKHVGNDLKKDINKLFKLLEIEIDGIFKSILLQKKKKYAALTVTEAPDGSVIVKRQAKGLDLVRRDWCDLSKVMGNTILDFILSGKPREEIIDNIHQYLRSVRDDIEQKKIPLAQITKGLTKDPQEYQDAKSQPHVQVALKMRNMGKRVRQGDFIPYVICEGEGSFAERAFSPDQITRSDGILKVDTAWYLTQQILPPVSRLCENIQGTDIPQLAACLGLDPSKYNRTIVPTTTDDNTYFAPTTELDAEEKYKNAEKFNVTCRLCGQVEAFPGIFRDFSKQQSGLSCKCGEAYTSGLLQNQLDLAFRSAMNKLYEGWLECDEHSCKNRTRQAHFYKTHSRCIVPGCKGVQRPEVTAEQLYLQLQYYQHIFDVEKYKPPGGKQLTEPVNSILSVQELSTFSALYKKAGQFISKSSLHHVNLSAWFTYYDVIKNEPASATPSNGIVV